jgi:hypothetical protein
LVPTLPQYAKNTASNCELTPSVAHNPMISDSTPSL